MSNNPVIFNAALSGATGGVNTRWLLTTDIASYVAIQTALIEFATAVDALIVANPAISAADGNLMLTICQGVWSDRVPKAGQSFADIAARIVALYTLLETNVDPVGEGWPGVLAVNNSSGTFNPAIPIANYLQFGDQAAQPTTGQIRSSAALRLTCVNNMTLDSTTGDILINSPLNGINITAGGTNTAISAGDVAINASGGITMLAGATTAVSVADGEIRCLGTGDAVFQTTGGGVAISAIAVPTTNPTNGTILLESTAAVTVNAGNDSTLNATRWGINASVGSITMTSFLTCTFNTTTAFVVNATTSFIVSTAAVERLFISSVGAYRINGSSGTAGQIFESAGTAGAAAWTGPRTITLSVVVPAVAAGAVGYVDTTLVGTALESLIGTNGGVSVSPQSDLVAAGAGGGYINARMSAANTLRMAFVGPLAGGAANFSVTKVR